MEMTQEEEIKSPDRLLEFDLSAELNHGIAVSNLAYAVAKQMEIKSARIILAGKKAGINEGLLRERVRETYG